MRRVLLYLVVVLIPVFLGCKKCLNKKGKNQSYTHKLEAFTELDIEGKFNVIIVQGNTPSVTFSGYQGIIETIRYESTEGVLTVRNHNKCSNINGYDDWIDLKIELDSFNFARFSVPGRLTSEGVLKWGICSLFVDNCDLQTNLNMEMNRFDLNMDGGTSTVFLSGKANRTEFRNNGNGHIYGKKLMSKKLYIYSIGTGLIEGTVSDFFLARVQGSTEVTYYGNPTTEDIVVEERDGARVVKN